MSRIKNISRPGWVVIGIVAALVLVPSAAIAVTSTVIIQGGAAAGQASVSAAHQLLTNEATPTSYVIAFSSTSPTCAAGGFYTIPSGKALIITGVTYYIGQSSGTAGELLYAGPSSTPCTSLLNSGISTVTVSQNQVFQPGIAVPAGDALGWVSSNSTGSFDVYGYLVPATAVAGIALNSSPGLPPGQSPTNGR